MNKTVAILAAALVSLCETPLAGADDVPTFDVTKSCRADAQAYGGQSTAAACLADEQLARDTLTGQWTTFSAESKSECRKMVTDIAGTESYVELLTCLQAAQLSKPLPKD
jgi:hypothetical protein